MGSTEIKSGGEAHNAATLIVTDDGALVADAELLVSVGGAGEPSAIWITSIYVRATLPGVFYFIHEDTAAWVDFAAARGGVLQDYALYATATGDGITGVNIGPITQDVYVVNDGTATSDTAAGQITITYDYV